MRSKLKKVLAFYRASTLLMFGAVAKAEKKARNGDYILSIYFHSPSKQLFESCVEWLIKRKFNFITIAEVQAIAKGEKPFPKGAVVITVDDGWQSNEKNIVAVADKFQIPVAIFISTQPVEEGVYWWSYIKEANKKKIEERSAQVLKKVPNEERLQIVDRVKAKITLEREALTVEQVKNIASNQLVTIGSHTVSHPILPTCDQEKATFEIKKSKEILESWLNKKVDSFAYPNGSFTDREIEILKEAGYDIAFSTKSYYLTPKHITDIYSLPRFEIFEKASFSENICRMAGVWFKSI